MANILYLSYDGLTDPLGQSQILPYLVGLSKLGHKISVISFEKKERYKEKHATISTIVQEASIKWVPLTYTKTPPILSTVWDMYKLKKTARKIVKAAKIDIVHCRSYISAIVGLALKRKYGIKFLFDIRGFWVDERVEGGMWNLKNPIFRLVYLYFRKIEKQLYKGADQIVSLTHDGKTVIEHWSWLSTPKVNVIPCCVDIDKFDYKKHTETTKAELRQLLNISEDQFVLTYLGSVGTWYMLDEMLDFFHVLSKKKSDAVFLFITPDDPVIIENKAIEKGIKREWLKIIKASRDEVPGFLSVSDYSIFFIKPVFSKRASSPTKQGELMAMGIPIVCNDNIGDTSSIIRKYNAGQVVENFDVSAYAATIASWNSSTAETRERLYSGADTYFSLQKGIENYNNIYISMLN